MFKNRVRFSETDDVYFKFQVKCKTWGPADLREQKNHN
jgi:hypothetical protein